jgi:5-(hydroxymethyl)furfural/furfural oxidase
MPTAPRANLNIPTIMVAEKVADLIIRESKLVRLGPLVLAFTTVAVQDP